MNHGDDTPPAFQGSPLDSPALGTSLGRLIHPCGDALRPAEPPATDGRLPIAVTLSGGGFRATFAGLGVLRYLADADRLADLRYVSSVSGGSVANGLVATRWPELRDRGFTTAAFDELVIEPILKHVTATSLKMKLIRNIWRTIGTKTRTDVLAWAFDDWLFDGVELEQLDPGCRWIFNAANMTTGVRFGFERDVLGDYVIGLAPTAGTRMRVAQAVAASASVPGAFAATAIHDIRFPCQASGVPRLLDGGAYDNTGLEALDGNRYDGVFTMSLNAGGVFVTGAFGKIPIVRDLARANSLLYRQSTSLRSRWMFDRFAAFDAGGRDGQPDDGARRGVLFALASDFPHDDPTGAVAGSGVSEFADFAGRFPEHRTFVAKGDEQDLAFVPTVFDRLDARLVRALIYRGWWLAGAAISRYEPDVAPLAPGAAAPPLEP